MQNRLHACSAYLGLDVGTLRLEVSDVIDRVKEYFAQSKIAGLLDQIEYPVTKQELMELAEENGAPDKVVELLDRLPDQTYVAASQVLESLRGSKEGD